MDEASVPPPRPIGAAAAPIIGTGSRSPQARAAVTNAHAAVIAGCGPAFPKPQHLDGRRPLQACTWGLVADAPAHWHDNLEVLWNERPLVLLLDGARHHLRQPTVVVIPAGLPHIARACDGAGAERAPAGSSLHLLASALQRPGTRPPCAGPLAPADGEAVLPLLRWLRDRLVGARALDEDLVEAAAGLLAVLRAAGRTTVPAAGPADTGLPAPVRAALSLIHQTYPDPALDVGVLARAGGVGAAQLRRLFVAALGEPPRRYLESFRLDRARRLLGQGRMTVAAVARGVGLSERRLRRRFVARFGAPPSRAVADT